MKTLIKILTLPLNIIICVISVIATIAIIIFGCFGKGKIPKWKRELIIIAYQSKIFFMVLFS